MNAQWPQIKALFDAAVQQAADGRATFLDQACGHNPDLRREIESLLAAHERAAGFIETPALTLCTTGTRGDLAGRRIGPYELISVIARGGMGVVYLAARADDEYQQRVAIKVIRETARDLDVRSRVDLLRRFRQERQTLAGLDHANIARLLDGGTTEDGRPYLVMEYIEGERLDVYCNRHGLSLSQRLQLFRTVCAAVSYAHQKLVIHRDLKPSNVLVTGAGADGVPKLLDFGLSKLLDAGDAGDATLSDWRPMTPAYASPEQIRGQPLTTASDVYSLGVILFELLTGKRPYRVSGSSAHEWAQAICEQEPDRPSSVVTRRHAERDVWHAQAQRGHDGGRAWPRWRLAMPLAVATDCAQRLRSAPSTTSTGIHPERLRRKLSGDLDTIILKALRKEPQRRYASVEQFSEDIGRHLEGRPVVARGDTWVYRTTKFATRHRAGVAAALLVALSLVGGIVATRRQARIADERRQAAENNLRRAEVAEQQAAAEAQSASEVAEFLVGIFGVADPFETAAGRSKAGIDVTAGDILRGGAEQISRELADEPLIRARLMDAIGRVYKNLGANDEADRLLSEALQTRRETLGDEHADVAASLANLGLLRIEQGEYAAAEPLLVESLQLRRRLLGETDARVAASLSHLASLMQATGRLDDARTHYEQALQTYRTVYGPDHAYVAMTLGNLAGVHKSASEFDAAEPLQREALETLQRLHGNRHPDVATCLNNLAAILDQQGKYEQAIALHREALALRRELLGEKHPDIAQSLNNLGAALVALGEFGEAEPVYREALDLRRELLPAQHPSLAESLNNLGHLMYITGRYAEAAPLLRAALDIRRAALSPDHPDLALSLHNVGAVSHMTGEPDVAEPLLEEALAIRQRTLPADHLDVAETLHSLGGLAYARGDLATARQHLEEVVRIRRSRLGDRHPRVAGALSSLAAVLRDMGEPAAAEPLFRDALAIQRQTWPQGHPDVAASLTGLGGVLTQLGRAAEAEPLIREALEWRRRTYPPGHWLIANTTSALGACMTGQDRFEHAEPLLLEAHRALVETRGPHDERTIQAARRIVELYSQSGRPADAAAWTERLRPSLAQRD